MNDWFEWNGRRCTELGIHVLEQPVYTLPAERSTFTSVPGRSGSLTTLEGDEVYDDIVLTATCMIDSESRIPALSAWLKGSGDITLMVGTTIVELTGVDESVTINCEMLECYKGSASCNAQMSGDFPVLASGSNAISWTGSVTKVVIQPNWRFL